jgi:hypothetical protein
LPTTNEAIQFTVPCTSPSDIVMLTLRCGDMGGLVRRAFRHQSPGKQILAVMHLKELV